jgi:hypothetical protein
MLSLNALHRAGRLVRAKIKLTSAGLQICEGNLLFGIPHISSVISNPSNKPAETVALPVKNKASQQH